MGCHSRALFGAPSGVKTRVRRWFALIAVAGLITAACGSDSESGADAVSGAIAQAGADEVIDPDDVAGDTADDGAVADPAEVEIEADPMVSPGAEVLESVGDQVVAAVDAWMAETGAPAVTLALALDESVLGGGEWAMAAGFADVTAGREATPDDLFRFGSITKPMTSTLILQLVEDGSIELDAPVATYLGDDWIEGYVLNEVDYGPLVTVRQILDHTDGFAEFAFDPGFYALVADRLDIALDPREVVAWAADRGPQFVPGTDYNYNTVGHIVAGLIIEELTGQDAAVVLDERLFVPAGAVDAYLPPTQDPPVDTVNGYVEGLLKIAIQGLAGDVASSEEAQVGDFLDISVAPQEVLRSAGWTGGGLEATATSVARAFSQMFDPMTLSAETVEAFTTPWDGEATGYGLGISRGDTEGYVTYSHGGGVPGFRSDAVYVPELGLTLAVSANLVQVTPDIGALSAAVLAVVTKAVADATGS